MKLFLHYLTFATSLGDVNYYIHPYHQNFYITAQGIHQSNYLNLPKLLVKWRHATTFLYNLFYYQSTLLTFTSKSLKLETLAFNWTSSNLDIHLFQFSQSYFFSKNNPYGDNSSYVYEILNLNGFDLAFISDLRYHYKTLFFLKRHSFYTFGLVPWNSSPWLVHYSIPVGSSNLISQYFFLKLLLLVKKKAHSKYFRLMHSRWR